MFPLHPKGWSFHKTVYMKNNYYIQTALKCCHHFKRKDLAKKIIENIKNSLIDGRYLVPHLLFDEILIPYDDNFIDYYHNKIKNQYYKDYKSLFQKRNIIEWIDYRKFITSMKNYSLFSYINASLEKYTYYDCEKKFSDEYFQNITFKN